MIDLALPPPAADTFDTLDRADLRRAVRLLEEDHLVTRFAAFFGKTFDAGAGFAARFLPASFRDTAESVVAKALRHAVDAALLTVDKTGDGLTGWAWLDRKLSADWFGTASVALTGLGGGAGGLPGTLVEFPVTTTMMMRSILQIARGEGEDLSDPATKLACLEVFALGGPHSTDDGAESGYFAVRLGMTELLKQASGRGLNAVMPRAVSMVAARFGVPASWKFAGQAVPAAGAAVGALINVAFVDHFQDKARGHFIVRRLERTYGPAAVRREYDALRAEWQADRAGE